VTDEIERSHSARVKAGLAAARARGVKLGGDRAGSLPRAQASAVVSIAAKADARASELRPLIRELQTAGITSLNAMAKALNARGIPSARQKGWTRQVVSQLLKRIDRIECK
jgi:DNA invertase Pin-like site-specific DNA recombinase